MNLINGRTAEIFPADVSNQKEDEEMLEDITTLIEKDLRFIVDRESFSYSRYATHLQYLFERIHTGKIFKTDNMDFFKASKKEFSNIYRCVEDIRSLIQREWNCEITEEEMLYLMLHINRIYTKQQQ